MQRKIGLFGGSFDPITTSHMEVCNRALKYLDEIWILPANISLYNKKLTLPHHRLNMCQITLNDYHRSHTETRDQIKICDYEIKNEITNNPTYEIINLLIKEYNLNIDYLYFIIGTDNLINLKKFQYYNELISKIKFIVIPREGYHIDPNLYLDVNYILIDCKPVTGSSTQVRNDKNISLINEQVKLYIEKYNLY